MSHTQVPGMYPALRYKDANAAIDWLCRAFGFAVVASHPNRDGTIAHAELSLGTAVVGLSSAGPATAANPWSDVRQGLYVCWQDVDAMHDRARAAGAEIVQPLKNQDYGSREFGAKDPGGHVWGFGTYREGKGEAGEAALFIGLHYDDGPGAIKFLTSAFGFTPVLEIPGPEQTIGHAELRLGIDTLMICSTLRDETLWNSHKQTANIWVADPDAHFARAQASGATSVRPIETTSYGARGYVARDPEGFVWSFSNYRPVVSATVDR